MSDMSTALVLALRDKRGWVRQSAVRTVEEIAPLLEAQGLILDILQALAPLGEDQDEPVRTSAQDAIGVLKAYSKPGVAAD